MSRGRALALTGAFIAIIIGGFLTGRALASSEFFVGQFAMDPRASGPGALATTGNEDQIGGTGVPEPGESSPPSDQPESPDKPAYWIDVDVTAQMVRVMQADDPVKEMPCSTGVEGHETPLGNFEIENRGTWFFSEKYQQGAKYWVSFKDWGLYLFHSLAMDKDRKIIEEEEAKLGQPASHGCVRLLVEDAKWIYDNVPERAKVVIHK